MHRALRTSELEGPAPVRKERGSPHLGLDDEVMLWEVRQSANAFHLVPE